MFDGQRLSMRGGSEKPDRGAEKNTEKSQDAGLLLLGHFLRGGPQTP